MEYRTTYDEYDLIAPVSPARCTWCRASTTDGTVVLGCWYNGMAYAQGVVPAKNICLNCLRSGRDEEIEDDRRESVLSEYDSREENR